MSRGAVASPDAVVVGAGLVGLATARALTDAGLTVLVLEAEDRPATHQSGHNSGVLHSGLYYRPGSLKAELTVTGRRRLEEYCGERGIRCERTGKVVLATRPAELDRLGELQRRGVANGLGGVRTLDREQIREIEPEADGIAGLWVPQTAILDYREVAGALVRELEQRGSAVRVGAPVSAIDAGTDGVLVQAGGERIHAGRLVNCAGLGSDRVARLAGARPAVRIVPFRGDYYRLLPGRRRLVRGLIYPVPDPAFPFLGVHLTRTIDGEVEAGPNAVLALDRHRYRRLALSPRDAWETATWPGAWRLAARHWRTGLGELTRAWSRALFSHSLRRLVPAIRSRDLRRAGCGLRAQAVHADGSLADDFELIHEGPCLHVLNAPSPAATACLEIGRVVAQRLLAA